ncbi:hypothetical protein Taro_056912, partial [Colocasia esculenta]|nr:hypothetical protein [Colocasia esculenta]
MAASLGVATVVLAVVWLLHLTVVNNDPNPFVEDGRYPSDIIVYSALTAFVLYSAGIVTLFFERGAAFPWRLLHLTAVNNGPSPFVKNGRYPSDITVYSALISFVVYNAGIVILFFEFTTVSPRLFHVIRLGVGTAREAPIQNRHFDPV